MQCAKIAEDLGEVPVGCVIVSPNGCIVGSGWNSMINSQTPVMHAEIMAISMACRAVGSNNLSGCAIYATLEPCAMCSAAISAARLNYVYYGASDPKSGAIEYNSRFFATSTNRYKPEIYPHIMEDESKLRLQSFFKNLR